LRPLKLTLKGFAGIRDGMGRPAITIDLEALAGDASLVALVGPNGAGKTTVIENLHPYRLMPSRASSYSTAGFSYYEHLYGPEACKDLEWTHDGRRFRSQLVFRVNGARRTEAYLHESDGQKWMPVTLPDGTRSDGKTDTYDRCVEALLGSPEVFFTSAFSAQNRKPLAAYKTGEVKSLMVELLQLDRVRETGEQTGRVASLLRVALDQKRSAATDVECKRIRFGQLEAARNSAAQEAASAVAAKTAAAAELEQAQQGVAGLRMERDASRENDLRRESLAKQICEAAAGGKRSEKILVDRLNALAARATKAQREIEAARKSAATQKASRAKVIEETQSLIARKAEIEAAAGQVAALAAADATAREQLQGAKEAQAKQAARRQQLQILETRVVALEREAGSAAIRAQRLTEQFGLTAEVPCQGTDLQPRCKLLGDAHQAKTLLPSAEADIARVRGELAQITADRQRITREMNEAGDVDCAVRASEKALDAVIEQRRKAGALACLMEQLSQAETRMATLNHELSEIDARLAEQEQSAGEEVRNLEAETAMLREHAKVDFAQLEETMRRLTTELAELPAAFAAEKLFRAEAALVASRAKTQRVEAGYIQAITRQAEASGEAKTLAAAIDMAAGAAEAVAALEGELSWWTLLAKALSNDGVIALCIDDAGPALASLTNDLLLTCYGPRFTVSITTQVETAKKELREGFDVVVFDAETNQAKSVSVMSGGEKVWINECLTRAIAIYLSHASGRRYQTLFSDEADGSLDSERKRMFMAMKREVLRLGGYEQEYFVSQTPALWELADSVINIGKLSSSSQPRTNLSRRHHSDS
jgi:exonuclease SbcC